MIKTELICTHFGGENGAQENALTTAFSVCADEAGHTGDSRIYDWLDDIPKTSMVCLLIDTLNRNGYEITKMSEQDTLCFKTKDY